MRLVLDTNIAVSGLLWGGLPGKLIDAAIGRRIDLVTSIPLIAELEDVLGRPKFADRLCRHNVKPAVLLEGFVALAEIVVPAAIPPVIVHDPADDQVLATAVAARANLIVPGDADFLNLGTFRGIDIITAAEAIGRIA